jgi:glycine/D-amino acid oxidase-like deaminating enzyme
VREAERISQLGAGELRLHPDRTTYCAPIDPHTFQGQPDGADLLLDRSLILERFPFVNPKVVAALHARRCGWFSGQQLGMYLLEQARAAGVELIADRVARVSVKGNRVATIHLTSGSAIDTRCFVNAAGPYLNHVSRLVGVELPVINELHLKIALKDTLGVVPRHAPLMIWLDPQMLPWSADERSDLADSADTRWLLDQLPEGVHLRPEGGGDSNIVLMLWAYHVELREVIVPPPLDEFFPEVVVRGLAAMIPALSVYFGKASIALYDGGYYTKTPENRPLAGPLPVEGAYVCGAVSGYGLMAAGAMGELAAAQIMQSTLPAYAAEFELKRYADPDYQRRLDRWGAAGQL